MLLKMFYLTVAGIIMMSLGSLVESMLLAGGLATFIGTMGMAVIGIDRY